MGVGGITIEDVEHFHDRRVRENRHMAEADRFFQQFSDLERLVYANGALDGRMKELMGLAKYSGRRRAEKYAVCGKSGDCELLEHLVYNLQDAK